MHKAKPSEVLFVLGMHRSGTSAISRAFNLLGYTSPKTLIKSNKSNPGGHWESTPIARLNDEILQAAGLGWSDWSLGKISTIRAHQRENFEQDIIATISAEFASDRPAIIKDPRICRLFEIYQSALAQADIPFRVVIPVRNPLAVAESLKKRNGISSMDANLLWLRHMLDGSQASLGSNRGFISYEEFLTDPMAGLRELIDELDLTPPYPLAAVENQITTHIDTQFQNHKFSSVDVAHDPRTEGWIKEAYEALLVMCKDQTAEIALKRLAAIKAEFDQANDILATVSTDFGQRLDDFKTDISNLNADISNLNASLNMEKERSVALEEAMKTSISDLNASSRAEQDLLKEENGLLKEEKDLLKEEKDLLEEENGQLSIQVNKSKRQIQRLKDELNWSRETTQSYLNSTSWRVSAPVRVTANILRRMKADLLKGLPNLRKKKIDASLAPDISGIQEAELARYIERLKQSKEFNKAYYLERYPEAASHARGAEAHYLLEGWKQGYCPSSTFETNAYLAAHPELMSSGLCPLIHYIDSRGSHAEGAISERAGAPQSVGRIAVFTAISNGYDDLKEPETVSENADYFVFTDAEIPSDSIWKPIAFEYVSHDPVRTARYIKTHPHLYFADYDWAIWIDANLQLVTPVDTLVPDESSGAHLSTWSHPLRTCTYVEAAECTRREKDDPQLIKAHMESLRKRGFPKQDGLFETSVVVSKMGDAKIVELFNLWWAEINQWSKRDQLSLPFAARSLGIEIAYLAPEKICMRTDPRFVYYKHAA